MSENISPKLRRYWIIAPLFLVQAIAACRMQDSLNLTILIPALLLLFLSRKKILEPAWTDLLVAGIWIWEAVLQLHSISHAASLPALVNTTAAVLCYFVLRLAFGDRDRIRALLTADSLLFGLLAAIGAVAFLLFRQRMAEGGFSDLYDFRALYMPLGNLTNVWANLLLGFLGTIILGLHYARRTKGAFLLILCLIPVSYGLVVTFSRGIYLSLAFLLVALAIYALFTRGTSWQAKILAAALVIAGSALLIMPYGTEVSRTLRMNETVSQQRSTEGRITAAETALELFREHPLAGTGSNTYSLAANPSLYENDPEAYTANASSLAVQIATEKGAVGTLLWALLLASLAWSAVRERKQTTTPILVLILIATLLIRELTFPVLLSNGGLLIILFTWAAILQNSCRPKPLFRIGSAPVRILRWLPLALWVVVLTASLSERRQIRIFEQAAAAMQKGDPARAREIIADSPDNAAGLAGKSNVLLGLYQASGDTALLIRAADCLVRAEKLNPRDILLQHNLATVLAQKGQKSEALGILNRLVEQYPDNPLYRSSLFRLSASGGDTLAALPHLVRAVASSPGLLDTPLCTGVLSGDSSVAAAFRQLLAEAMLRKSEDPIVLAKQARIHLFLGDTATACTYWKEAVAALPNLSRPWAYLGMAAYSSGDPENGRRYLRASLAISPYDPLARYYWESYTGETLPAIPIPKTGSYAFLYTYYDAKFMHWYRCPPIPAGF